MSDTAAPAPATTEDVQAVRWVRLGCWASIGLILLRFVAWFWGDWRVLWALLFSVVLCWPYLLVLRRLRKGPRVEALRWASVVSAAAFCAASVVGFFLFDAKSGWSGDSPWFAHALSALTGVPFWAGRGVMLKAGYWWMLTFLAGVMAVQIPLFLAAVRTREVLWPGAVGKIYGLAGVLMIFFYYLFPLPALSYIARHSRAFRNAYYAVYTLGMLRRAAKEYEIAYRNGFPPSWQALASVPSGGQPNCRAADLIDTFLQSGTRRGYVFEYKAGPEVEKPAEGCPPRRAQLRADRPPPEIWGDRRAELLDRRKRRDPQNRRRPPGHGQRPAG